MANFICRNRANQVIATWSETTLEEDLRRCTQLVLEAENLEDITVSPRKFGDSAQLQGKWNTSPSSLIDAQEAAPELNQELILEEFPDRYAHSVVHQTYIQRADFIYNVTEELDYEDQQKFYQRLFRDMSASIRALVGDVLDLQERLGEAMMRIDNLENYDKFGDENFHNLPGSTSNENPSLFPLPSPPYYIGKELISNDEEQTYYHQGYTVTGIDGGLRRYYSAQESRGISPPTISPREIADENIDSNERYDQGGIANDGGPVCRNGESREGFGTEATCSSNGGNTSPSYPEPVVPVIPIFTTPFYKPQFYSTGIAIVSSSLQRVYPVPSNLVVGNDDEVFHYVNNPLCVPHSGNLTPLPKCLFPAVQPNPFLPMPPFPEVTGECTQSGEASLAPPCPQTGA